MKRIQTVTLKNSQDLAHVFKGNEPLGTLEIDDAGGVFWTDAVSARTVRLVDACSRCQCAECEHCGASAPSGEPHHCWQSGHHNE